MVRPLRTGPSATCLSQVPGGGWRSRYPRLIACQCVSLAFRSGGQSQQPCASCSLPEKKSVTAVTDVRDCGQTGCNEFSVFPRTGRVRMNSKRCQWLEGGLLLSCDDKFWCPERSEEHTSELKSFRDL